MPKANQNKSNVRNRKKTLKLRKREKAICHLCGKSFSKPANVKTHIQRHHEGQRWKCPICEKTQVSRHSHLRHYASKHKGEPPIDPDANMCYSDGHVDNRLPEQAIRAITTKLEEKSEFWKHTAKEYRKKLLKKSHEIIHLKARYGLDAEQDKQEYNDLIGQNIESENGSVESESVESESENSDESSEDDDESDKNIANSTGASSSGLVGKN